MGFVFLGKETRNLAAVTAARTPEPSPATAVGLPQSGGGFKLDFHGTTGRAQGRLLPPLPGLFAL